MLSLSSLRLGFRALVRTSSLVVASAAALIGQTPSANDGFDPNLNGPVFAAVTQRDGKVIVGGAFTTVVVKSCPVTLAVDTVTASVAGTKVLLGSVGVSVKVPAGTPTSV
jgi:hypothetical protein